MYRKSFILAIPFLLFCCSVRENKSTATTVSPLWPAPPASAKRLDRWLNYYRLDLSAFSDSVQVTDNYMTPYDFDPESDKNNPLKDFFIYSPDSLYYLDLDSYSLTVEETDDQQVSYGSEADTEVALVYRKEKQRRRVLFCGTECWAEEADWIDAHTVCMPGIVRSAKGDFPVIWLYNVTRNDLLKVAATDPVDITGKNYARAVRLNAIKFID